MKRIPLTQGQFAFVDDEDFEWLSKFKWCALLKHPKIGYWIATTTIKDKKVSMHRMIMNAPKDKDVDHKNHNGLDNRRENLRACTQTENNRNRNRQKNNTSGYKGVSWNKWIKKWESYITINGEKKFLGYFDDKIRAAKCYDKAAKSLYGEFAKLNF